MSRNHRVIDQLSEIKATNKPFGGISACIITYNEEQRLQRCLDSLTFVDEIIVLDSNSSDKTCEIALRAGVRVETRTFCGYASQRNHAISLARNQWVLVIDADEVISPGLQDEILENLLKNANITGKGPTAYRFPRISYYCGSWIKHSGWYPEYRTRLFINGQALFYGETVHETIQVKGSIKTLHNNLEHYSYQNISDHLKRIDRYSSLVAQDKFAKNKKSSVLLALGKAFSKFVITYFYHLGFLDGRQGIIIAVLAGYYNFVKYTKLWELNVTNKSGNQPKLRTKE